MDTWWIDRPHLIGSRNPTLADLEQLRRDGFGGLISLLDEREQSPRYDIGRATALGFVRHNIPVKDFRPPTVEQLEEFVAWVAGLPAGAKTVVHCEGGTGRTGTFAAAYWIAKGLTLSEAIAHVRRTRPHAVETPEQETALSDFAGRRKGRPSFAVDRIGPGILGAARETMSETQPAEPAIAAVNASTFVGSPCRAIAARTAQAHELILKVAADLSDEQLTRRPADVAPSVAPPVAWHLWHIARWADFVQASLNGMAPELEPLLGPGRQIWDAEDLAARWGLAAAAGYRNTGMGLDDEGSARLRLPERTLLLDYARRAFAKANRAVSAVDEELFVTPCTDLYEQKTSIGTVVMSHLTHANRHLGMIEALKGMLGVRGTATL